MSKEWSNGLFECFGDCGACIYTCFCPACSAGEIYRDGDLGSCFVGCLLFCFLECCHPCIVTGPLREKRGIEGGCMGDTCAFFCCPLCQLTRELREVRGT
mmetsp:Transcript_58304/g.96640  ORF Transcript_58304/g.96640 Transcript_58304/m.96640 type:complete len:100 (+) Transcript_58304:118-417(+)